MFNAGINRSVSGNIFGTFLSSINYSTLSHCSIGTDIIVVVPWYFFSLGEKNVDD